MSSKVTVVGDKLIPGNDQITRSMLENGLTDTVSSAYAQARQLANKGYAYIPVEILGLSSGRKGASSR